MSPSGRSIGWASMRSNSSFSSVVISSFIEPELCDRLFFELLLLPLKLPERLRPLFSLKLPDRLRP